MSEWIEGKIVCPYCSYSQSDIWEYEMRDDDTLEIDCGECERIFQTTLSVSYSYKSKPLEAKSEKK